MLRTSAAALVVAVLIAGPVAAQPTGAKSSKPTTTNQDIRSSNKSTSMLKQTHTTKMQKSTGKLVIHRRLRQPAVYNRASRHLALPHHTLSSHGHTQSNGSHKTSKIESNTNAQK